MTKQDISHWTISTGKTGLLLFAQAFEELIAPHSHDSYKVSALNFHYICHEVLNVIDLIEDRSIQTLVDAVQFQEYQYLQLLCSDSVLDGNGIKTFILRKEC